MAKYVIRQGSHRALPFTFGIYFGKKKMDREVIFHEDCRYDLGGEDQQDWNKLFGLGYLWSIHDDSARFGWRYNTEKDCIEIVAYVYDGGNRVMEWIGDVEIGVPHLFSLEISPRLYHFNISDVSDHAIAKSHNKFISYKCGLYFGGNKTAPHAMHITINKV